MSLKNPQSEEVRVLLDGVELGLLAPSESKEFKVPGGKHALEARGVDTLSSNRQAIDVPPAVTLPLVLAAPVASLVVTNRHSEPLAIAVGDRDLGVILPGDRVTLKDVRPGAYALVAKSLKRPLSWTESVTLRAGDVHKWDLQQ